MDFLLFRELADFCSNQMAFLEKRRKRMGIKEIFDVVVAMLEVVEESMGSKENTGKAEALEYEERIGIAQSILAPIWGDRVATETYLKLTKRALSLNVEDRKSVV